MPYTPISDDLYAAMLHDNEREAAGMHADVRRTCWPHQCWAEQCADHVLHTNPDSVINRAVLRAGAVS